VLHTSFAPQLLSIVEICSHLSGIFLRVDNLRIEENESRELFLPYNTWPWVAPSFVMLIRSFKAAKYVHLSGDLCSDVVRTLQPFGERGATLLPVLHKLCIGEPRTRSFLLLGLVVALIVDRRLSGHHIAVEYEPLRTNGLA
jgi:hypothetical protein